MRHILSASKDTRSSLRRFRKTIENIAIEKRRQMWTFPNGERVMVDTYYLQARPKRLAIGLGQRWNSRIPHLFCFEGKNGPLSPDVEINIPLKLDRRVSGAYVGEHRKEVWLCTRGDFTVFRRKIPRKTVFQHFAKWLVPVEDNGRSTHVIPVASLSSRSLTNDIVAFVRAVIDLKNKFKTGGAAKVTSTTKWREGKESEGRKKGRRSAAEFEYEYLHGPVCNALQTALKKLPGAGKDFVVRRNKQVDLALVQREKPIAIFEVKTSASLSKQLYSAIGQLLYYRRKYGGPETKLFLVLPSVAVPRGFPHSKFFDSLDVYVVFVDDNGSFYLSNSKTLRAILEDSGCIPKPSTRMAPKRTRPTKSARVGNLVLKGASKFPQEGRLSGTKIDDDSKIELTAPQVESTEGLPSAAG